MNNLDPKSELEEMTKERNRWRIWFWVLGAVVLIGEAVVNIYSII